MNALNHVNTDIELEAQVRELVNRRFNEARAKRPGYSLRAFARDLRIVPSSLSGVLNGKRRLTPQLIEQLLSGESEETRVNLARRARDLRQVASGRYRSDRMERPEVRQFQKAIQQIQCVALQQISEKENDQALSYEELMKEWVQRVNQLAKENHFSSIGS